MSQVRLAGTEAEKDFITALDKLHFDKETIDRKQQLLNKFSNYELPTRRHEEWKWIDPRVVNPAEYLYDPARFQIKEEFLRSNEYSCEIEITDKYITVRKDAANTNIVVQTNLPNADSNGKYKVSPADKISTLNDLYWTTGFHVVVKSQTSLDKPVFISEKFTGTKICRNIIELQQGSKASVIHVIDNRSSSFNDLRIFLGDSSNLDYFNIQTRERSGIDVSRESVILNKNASCNWFSFIEGSKITKLNQNCFFTGE
ncbi:MAG: SufD family Fe-S cluster assembly protein, partial [Planctomycetes bacterium]|nr:SufD family Fe-S cluster assembly protein [Planctomycetota bacterium]